MTALPPKAQDSNSDIIVPDDLPDMDAPQSAESFATAGLTPIERRYAWVIRADLAFNALLLMILVSAGDYFLAPRLNIPHGIATGVIAFALILLILIFPIRRVASIRYHISEDHIRIRRGFLFTIDTIVPFVRVQHIDVSQGPVERALGLSSLSVHTSGVRNQAVTLPGLQSSLAEAMRATIHRHILTDFE